MENWTAAREDQTPRLPVDTLFSLTAMARTNEKRFGRRRLKKKKKRRTSTTGDKSRDAVCMVLTKEEREWAGSRQRRKGSGGVRFSGAEIRRRRQYGVAQQ